LIKDSLTTAMPNRALRIVSRGGHWIQFECADEVNAELMRWFSVGMPS
jgi:pimeloyl-ACP methyl ester carboxylesterase